MEPRISALCCAVVCGSVIKPTSACEVPHGSTSDFGSLGSQRNPWPDVALKTRLRTCAKCFSQTLAGVRATGTAIRFVASNNDDTTNATPIETALDCTRGRSQRNVRLP